MQKSYKGIMLQFENGLIVGNGANASVRPPSTYKVSTSDIDLNTKRSTTGYMTRNRVRGGATAAYSVEVSWDRLDWDELVRLIAAGENPKFNLTFVDPKSKTGTTTKSVYRDANMSYQLINIFEDEEAYWTTTMTFIEY